MLTALTSGRFSLCRKCSGFPAALLYLFGAYSKRSTSLRAHTTSLPLTQRPYVYEFALMCSLVLPIASAHICTSVTSSSFNTGHRSYSHDVRSLAVQSPIVPSTVQLGSGTWRVGMPVIVAGSAADGHGWMMSTPYPAGGLCCEWVAYPFYVNCLLLEQNSIMSIHKINGI